MLENNKIHHGDSSELMKQLDKESVDFCMTSPPYLGLRDYGVEGQIGLEEHPNQYIKKMVSLFKDLKIALKKTGSFYLNMGDTYYGSNSDKNSIVDNSTISGKGHQDESMPEISIRNNKSIYSNWLQPKQLMLIPSRLAIALQEDGWILRNDIIWHKPNPMPSSVKDRLNCTYEHLFHFVKNKKYYYDLDAIRDKHNSNLRDMARMEQSTEQRITYDGKWSEDPTQNQSSFISALNPLGKNPGDVVKQKLCSMNYEVGGMISPSKRAAIQGLDLKSLNHPLGKNPGDVVTQPYSVQPRDKEFIEYRELPKIKEFAFYINEVRKAKGLTIEYVEETFKNQAAHHWFNGESFPNKEDYLKLKSLLGLKDFYDKEMTEVFKKPSEKADNPQGKNPGDFFQITTQPFPEAHFAVYPVALCEKPIKSSVPGGVCVVCGAVRERIIEREFAPDSVYTNTSVPLDQCRRMSGGKGGHGQKLQDWRNNHPDKTIGWTKCNCNKGFKGAVVLDPFCGAGTTWVALKKFKPNAKFIGFELNKEYIDMAYLRVGKRLETGPLLNFMEI